MWWICTAFRQPFSSATIEKLSCTERQPEKPSAAYSVNQNTPPI
ncbi:hypothetical protein [Alysiella crassa]|nr:hypothetical protein [Alysiella crassa]